MIIQSNDNECRIFQKGVDTEMQQYRAPALVYNADNQTLSVQLSIIQANEYRDSAVVTTNSKIRKDRWYTITISYSQGLTLVYVNGVLDVVSDITPYQIDFNDQLLAIGPNNQDCAFVIKSFEIYNRIMKASEIEAKSAKNFY